MHICAESNSMRNEILISYSYPLVYRCTGCSKVPRPSIRTSVISETISASTPRGWMTCLLAPDALTQITQQVRLDRGVLLQPVLLRTRALELGNVCLQQGGTGEAINTRSNITNRSHHCLLLASFTSNLLCRSFWCLSARRSRFC